MENKKILLALKERDGLSSISEYLRQKGLTVFTANDGAGALEIVLNERPSIIIFEMGLSIIDTERVFQILRNNPHTSDIPFIFIGSESKDIKGFNRDMDSLLLQPVRGEDIFRRIKIAFVSKGEVKIGDREIAGSLSHISLGDLLQILHINKKEGILRVYHEDKEGLIYVKDGNIYNASLGGVEKEKALFRFLAWHDGKFEFLPKTIDVPQKIHHSTGNLLMEGMRQYDEWNKAKEQFPKPYSQIRLKVDVSSMPKGLKPVIYEIFSLAGYYPAIGDLVDHCSFPDYEVYQTLASLMRKGIIEEVKEKRGAEKGRVAEEVVTSSQALKVREKLSLRWKDMEVASTGKIFILSASDRMVADLLDSCKDIPNFSLAGQRENPLGDIGTFKIYGGMDIVLFAIPLNMKMKPLLKAFSKNMIGVIILSDAGMAEDMEKLASAKDYILSIRRTPVLYTLITGREGEGKKEEDFRKALDLKRDERVFAFESMNREKAFQILRAFFGCLLKDEYIAA